MDMSRPVSTLLPSLEGEVLMVLAGTTRPLTGHEVSRLASRGSVAGIRKVLGRLVDHGLVEVSEAGSAYLYVLNRDHLLAPIVDQLSRIRTELFDRIRRRIAAWETPPVSAAVFGSTARGEGDYTSDIDVLVVRPDHVNADDPSWRGQVSLLSEETRRWTGNRASMIEVSQAEASAMSTRGEPVVQEVLRDAVLIAGEPVGHVFSGTDR